MKNVETKKKIVVLVVLLLVIPELTYAQSLEAVKNYLEGLSPAIKSIFSWFLNLILMISLGYVIYAYSSKKENAKDYLNHAFIAFVIAGLAKVLFTLT